MQQIYAADHAHNKEGGNKSWGVLERLWLTGLTTFRLWAAFSRAWGLAAQGSPWSALCAGNVPSLSQSVISDPSVNLGLGHEKLHSSAAHHVHWVGLHTSTQWEKATGVFCTSDQATHVQQLMFKEAFFLMCICKYICLIFSTLHNVSQSPLSQPCTTHLLYIVLIE